MDMRGTTFLLVALLVVAMGWSGCTTVRRESAELAADEYETQLYEVFGMNCPGCHEGLEKLVKKIPAVLDAKANWREQQLLVVLHPQAELKDEDVYDAIRRANFTVGKRLR
jgi:copper chaperone CopZ